MANRLSTAVPGSTRKSIFGHSYLSTPGRSPGRRPQKSYEDESNLLETPDVSQLIAQTPLRGIKTLKSGSGWDYSVDGTEELHTPPRRLFGDDDDDDDDVNQEEYDPEDDAGSFVEEDTVLGGPPRGASDDENEYGEETGLGEGGSIVLPKVLDFTTARNGADSLGENEDEQPPPKFATSATPLHPVGKSLQASVDPPSLAKVDIPLERFVVRLARCSSQRI